VQWVLAQLKNSHYLEEMQPVRTDDPLTRRLLLEEKAKMPPRMLAMVLISPKPFDDAPAADSPEWNDTQWKNVLLVCGLDRFRKLLGMFLPAVVIVPPDPAYGKNTS